MDGNTYAVGVVHDGTAVSVTESLTQIEIEIVNSRPLKICLFAGIH